MASSNCGLFEILVILGTKLVFYTDSSFCCGDVMRFMRLHNEPLVCRRAGRLGRAWGTPACFVRFDRAVISEPWLGCDFWFHLLSHQGHDNCLTGSCWHWSEKVLIDASTGASFMLCPLNQGGDRDREQGTAKGSEDQLPFVSLAFSNRLCSK